MGQGLSRNRPTASDGNVSNTAGLGSQSRQQLIPPPSRQPSDAEILLLPGYEILEKLGQGGMGVVYRARQISLNRLVALKMLLAGVLEQPQHRERFRREAKAVAQLNHPNVVQIYDVGEVGGRPYYSMELIEGGSLRSRVSGQPQPSNPAARLVEILARAVHHMHQQGIVHRDLTPANILLQAPLSQTGCLGIPKITDFGLAKHLDDKDSLTPTGWPIGTACYMSPEQVRGDRSIGQAADIYGLGAILYSLLTGKPPFTGTGWYEISSKVCNHQPEPPTALRRDLHLDLERICLKCLEKDPAKRYPSADALASDLRGYREGKRVEVQTSRGMQERRLTTFLKPLKTDVKLAEQMSWARRAGFEVIDLLPQSSRLPAFRALHRSSNRYVILRVLEPPAVLEKRNPMLALLEDSTWEQFLEDLRTEACTLARLQHPSIPRPVEFGEQDGYHFLAIEYAEGTPLSGSKELPLLAPAESAHLLHRLALTLQHAHEHGVVHRDLRAKNILVNPDGMVWLTNFGVIRREQVLKTTGEVLARLRYMAPEQAMAPEEHTPASNIYVLGTIFYELLAHRPPFEPTVVLTRAYAQLLSETPAGPSRWVREVPPDLDQICLKCLEKSPQQRYPSARSLAVDLHQFLARDASRGGQRS